MKTFCLLLALCLMLSLVARSADAVSDFDPADDEKEENHEKRGWSNVEQVPFCIENSRIKQPKGLDRKRKKVRVSSKSLGVHISMVGASGVFSRSRECFPGGYRDKMKTCVMLVLFLVLVLVVTEAQAATRDLLGKKLTRDKRLWGAVFKVVFHGLSMASRRKKHRNGYK
ncbi:hypothetical protein C0Q70_16456 [Pomacea canaliculata]|uniref:Uncharacterized protein n=1 Tax=Pomacea canaliculata TaxID=400727 RepID=A0A2T7NPW7_POMCA|nr:hypothetical protein C0Q70_16456 [Pomacea canaliculata]